MIAYFTGLWERFALPPSGPFDSHDAATKSIVASVSRLIRPDLSHYEGHVLLDLSAVTVEDLPKALMHDPTLSAVFKAGMAAGIEQARRVLRDHIEEAQAAMDEFGG